MKHKCLALVLLITLLCACGKNDEVLNYSHGQYIGEVENGKANGKGTYTSKKSGTIYKGRFFYDTFSGDGTMTWRNGDKFTGTWDNDVGTSGTMTYANGANAEGTVRAGKFLASKSNQNNSPSQNYADRSKNILIADCLAGVMVKGRKYGDESVDSISKQVFAKYYTKVTPIMYKVESNCPTTIDNNCIRNAINNNDDFELAERLYGNMMFAKTNSQQMIILGEIACRKLN